MPDDAPLKFCSGCKHHNRILVSSFQIENGCARLGVRHIVTGELIHSHCLTERMSKDKDACGWDARYWEPKLNG